MVFCNETPMAEIIYSTGGKEKSIFAKVESFNPSGSIKDRVAEYIVEKAMERGELKKGQPIVEVTSGNTGIAFAAQGAEKGFPVHIFMPSWASEERKKLMKMYGAVLHEVSREEGGFLGAFQMADQLAEEIGAYLPRQFENRDNIMAHYLGTGQEIVRKVPDATDFISGVGTGGTLMGVAKAMKEAGSVRAVAIQPASMQLLTTGKITGPHKIEGIGDDFVPAIVDRKQISRVVDLSDDDAVIMAARLAKELGLAVGISSGANFLGCVLAQEENEGRKAVTVFADDNKKYLTTSLSDPPEAKEEMISSRVKLIGVRRV